MQNLSSRKNLNCTDLLIYYIRKAVFMLWDFFLTNTVVYSDCFYSRIRKLFVQNV